MNSESPQGAYRDPHARLKKLLGLGLAFTAVVIGAIWLGHRARLARVHSVVELPQNVSRRLSNYTFTQSKKDHRLFTVYAARTLAYGPGSSMVLEDVRVVIYEGIKDHNDEIRAARCTYDPKSGALACFGGAALKIASRPHMQPAPGPRSRQPALLNTTKVSYDPNDFSVKTTAPVSFRFGTTSGKAQGLVYNTRTGRLLLPKDVYVTLPRRSASAPPLELRASSLIYQKRKGKVALLGPVQVTGGPQRLQAADGTIFLDLANRIERVTLCGRVSGWARRAESDLRLTAGVLEATLAPATSHLLSLKASGSVRLVDSAPGEADDRQLEASVLQVNFAGSKPRPRFGFASGNVKLAFEPEPTDLSHGAQGMVSGPRILTTSTLLFSFQGANELREAHTDGPGTLRLIPATAQYDERTITAGELKLEFDSQGHMRTLRGWHSARLTDQPPPDAKDRAVRETSSRNLVAILDPATDSIERILQQGDFQFQAGDRRASADKAIYRAASQRLTLYGHPQVWNSSGNRVRADKMVVDLANGRAEGRDHVQSVHFWGLPSQTPMHARKFTAKPGNDLPLVVVAQRVIADRNAQEVRYEGGVRAWWGADMVKSSSLEVLEKNQRIRSGYGVTSSFIAPPSKPRQSSVRTRRQVAVQPVVVQADRLLYSNPGREAVYEGKVRMRAQDAVFRADLLRIFLSPASADGSPQVERAVATGHVLVTQPPGRRATASRAEYFASTGKVVLTGGPPTIYDAKQGFSTGARLTFYIRDASLLVDGGKKSQTLSKRRILRR